MESYEQRLVKKRGVPYNGNREGMFIIAVTATKKIFTVSMVKNEIDLIETFVRYHLAIVDGMAILDNCSSDGTTQVLEKLVDEGLPVYLLKDKDQEYLQAKKTTELLYQTIRSHRPDVVVPLDCDEFLDAEAGMSPRAFLETLEDDALYFLCAYDRKLRPENRNPNCFRFEEFPRKNRTKTFFKVCFTANFMEKHQFSLSEGNHDISVPIDGYYLPFSLFYDICKVPEVFQDAVRIENPYPFDLQKYLLQNAGKATYLRVYPDEIFLSHFPHRSAEQMKSKICIGWITICARDRKFFNQAEQYSEIYDLLRVGKEAAACERIFTYPEETTVDAVSDHSCHARLACRYTPSKPVNSFAGVLSTALQLARAHAKQQAFLKEREAECAALRQYKQKYLLFLLGDLCKGRRVAESVRELKAFPIAAVAEGIRDLPDGAPENLLDEISRKMCELYGAEETLRWAEIEA